MTLAIRSIRPDEVFAFRDAVMRVFGADAEPGEGDDAKLRALLDTDRAIAAFDGGEMVGTSAAFTFELTVPGGTAPMAGLTMVTVRPSHRRRGALRAMMNAHLEDVRGRGEPLSGLWASETSIYGRFGYGPATETDRVAVDVRGAEFDPRPGADAVEMIHGDALRSTLPPIYERARPDRPGALSRTEAWWRERTLSEQPHRRQGASTLRAAVSLRGDEPNGYVLYRQRPGWEDNLPAGRLDVVELVALDGVAEATLWRLVCSVDLFPNVTWWNAPSDSLLPWLVLDRRRVQRRRLDNLWLRPCDVAAALSARRYAEDGALSIHVDDPLDPRNAGGYALRVEDGVGRCERGEDAPRLRTDAAGLGAMYLGAVRPSLLARAGRLEGDAETLERADRMFAWPSAPWCPEVF